MDILIKAASLVLLIVILLALFSPDRRFISAGRLVQVRNGKSAAVFNCLLYIHHPLMIAWDAIGQAKHRS